MELSAIGWLRLLVVASALSRDAPTDMSQLPVRRSTMLQLPNPRMVPGS